MGFFTRLEKLSEKYIEGFFKSKFAEHVQPAEIAKLLLREMRDRKTVSVAKVYVPNQYTVFLGNEDWKTIDSVQQTLSAELQEFLRQKAGDKGYETVGEIRVAFELDEKLHLGAISVESSFSEELPGESDGQEAAGDRGPEPSPAEFTLIADRERFHNPDAAGLAQDTLTRLPLAVPAPKAMLVQKLGGKEGAKFPLGIRGVLVGRRRTNDICLDDKNVSRVHASIDYIGGSYYITDLGSTNGTFVNGVRVVRKKLAEGDLIRMGTTVLEFKVV